MRESINCNMIPLPCDNMNDILNVGSRIFLTNVSSNAYYGYQPQHYMQNKESYINDNKIHLTKDNTSMEVQYSCEENRDIHASRKRRCCYDEIREFKKRRQNNQYIPSNSERERLDAFRKEDKQRREMEDILRETHGVNMYHWLQNEDC